MISIIIIGVLVLVVIAYDAIAEIIHRRRVARAFADIVTSMEGMAAAFGVLAEAVRETNAAFESFAKTADDVLAPQKGSGGYDHEPELSIPLRSRCAHCDKLMVFTQDGLQCEVCPKQ